MRILIVNQHTNNFGDDAAGNALVEELCQKYNEPEINIIYNADKGIDFGKINVINRLDLALKYMGKIHIFFYLLLSIFHIPYKLCKTINEYKKLVKSSDYIIIAPSGANIGIYKDWRLLVRLKFVIDCKKTPIFHLNTINSSGSKIFDFFSKKILKKSKIYVREQKSLEYIQNLGLFAEKGVDTAFLLPNANIVKNKKLISIVLSELDSWHPSFKENGINDFTIKFLSDSIRSFIINNDYQIQIIPHVRNSLEREIINEFVAKICEKGISKERVLVREDIVTYKQYEEHLAESRFVIGMRYHTIVLASKNYVPFISLAYENKMNEVCNYLNMNKFNIQLNVKDRNEISERFNTLLKYVDENIDSISDFLSKQIPNVKAKARIVIDSLDSGGF